MGNVHSTLVLAITLTSMISIDFQGFGWIWEPFLGDGFGYFCHLPMLQHKPVRCRCYTPDMVNRRLAMLPQWGQVRVAHVVPICSKSLTYPEILIDTHTAILCLCLIMEVPQNSLYFFCLTSLTISSPRKRHNLGQTKPYVCCSRVALSWSHRYAMALMPLARHDRAVHVTHRATTDPPRRSGAGLSSEDYGTTMGKPWENHGKTMEKNLNLVDLPFPFFSILFHISMIQCFIFNEHNRTQARPSVAPTSRASQTLSPNLAKHSGPRLAKWVKLRSFEIKIMLSKGCYRCYR